MEFTGYPSYSHADPLVPRAAAHFDLTLDQVPVFHSAHGNDMSSVGVFVFFLIRVAKSGDSNILVGFYASRTSDRFKIVSVMSRFS